LQGDHRKILERLFHQFPLLLGFFLANLLERISSQARVAYFNSEPGVRRTNEARHEWAQAIEA
jgi:hypothetical protein